MVNWTRDQKMAYYFWLDGLILTHWAEYLDLQMYGNRNSKEVENKLKLIDYYQGIQDGLGEEFSWSELHDWYKSKHGQAPPFIRFWKDLFSF